MAKKKKKVDNHHYSDKAWKKVNEENKALVFDYIEYLRSINRMETTIKGHSHNLKVYLIYICDHCRNKGLWQMRPVDFSRLRNYALESWNWSTAKYMNFRYSISAFMNYILSAYADDERFKDVENYILQVAPPKPKKIVVQSMITDAQLEKLIAYLDITKKYEALVYLMVSCYSGLAITEILQLDLSDFDDNNVKFGCLYQTHPIEQKTYENETIYENKYIITKVKPYIDKWREQRRSWGVNIDSLFVVRQLNGTFERRKTIKWMDEFTEILGSRVNHSMLKFRLCDRLIGENIPVNVVKSFFKWNYANTQHRFTVDDSMDEFIKFFNNTSVSDDDDDLFDF